MSIGETCLRCPAFKVNEEYIKKNHDMAMITDYGIAIRDTNSKFQDSESWRLISYCKFECPYELERLMEEQSE